MPVMPESYWLSSTPLPKYPALDHSRFADVVVIGAGVTGLTAAYLLKQAGLKVVVLDRRTVASGDTGHTTAHLTCVTDTWLMELIRAIGEDHARAVWDAGLAAIWQIAEIVDAERISCGLSWVPAYLHAPPDGEFTESDVERLREEAQAAANLGFDATFVERAPVVDAPAVEFAGQARFHLTRYLKELAARVDGDGSAIFEHTDAHSVEDDPLTVVAGSYRLRCNNVFVATHNPIVGKASLLKATLLQTKLSLYSTYVVAGRAERDQVFDALYWDTATAYRYLRLDRQRDGDLVILGGEDHKTGQVSETSACYEALERAAVRLVPGIELSHRWSGQVIETSDGLPFIGEISPHQFIATGFNGNGVTFGTLSAMIVRDAITGRANPWRGLFDVNRSGVLRGFWDYLKENKDYPYYLIRDRFAGAQGKTTRALARGKGKILELDGTRVAAYRHENGRVTLLSLACTHMGCQVVWNDAEATWDCPCHGSRFTATGDVIGGPAESPLDEITAKVAAKAGQ
ncbi:MAG TPA: FAD-dependent oxidoreductase [Vicinamibacterales bacterium]|nr:FAD-dependent oxidoreductase [Vicinamibacterales bacterium]